MNAAESAQRRLFKDNYAAMSNMVDICFRDCVNDFTSKTLSGKEETCVKRCTEKFLKLSMRVDFNAAAFHMEQQKAGAL
ncbi:hypothetical protein BCR33DRAFT_847513 [Rhizoclosmatium globosum]|uniref:Mitochondrial import inner membrane translocase subunit n=1 Tax=Rhizoclosmatium globosum TaxID=329046 RepID=A0A1Y2CRA9_9FUNG|nr:protein transporter tim9 [Rhizoclosmatium hyalinum]KAJ3296372.1 protein transporter tim9 [Rhizoclosmatium sp. JEL0117]ORY49569.1 hypothetical protein BCR33DRAFT_847513 [Rhizoclosmatium globosum]|eukprot:ORY49569.1 hypothetical protein BCR33DRAFT_847513 [Rhizoclosmatium globosum]